MEHVDTSKLESFTPEKIAHTIISNEAKDPLSHQILIVDETTDLTYVFEILLTILLEGLDIITFGFKRCRSNNF